MPADRPIVLSIAGFDPSSGAGVTADVKTFEQHRVYGLSVITANTIQTEDAFVQTEWVDLHFVLRSVDALASRYNIKAVKIGIVPSLSYIDALACHLRTRCPSVSIIWDTVLKSSTDFSFLDIAGEGMLPQVLKQIDLITPNYTEVVMLGGQELSAVAAAAKLSKYTAVLLKGGHHTAELGTDYLYTGQDQVRFPPGADGLRPKHGSGCVLSAAITANIALGMDWVAACGKAKGYTESFLNSNHTLLGYHYVG
jgi:hydroxymethylpyrimidine/phosphomethylpyrimidine kinase